MATLLINKAKVSSVLQVAIGYNEQEFNHFIREAQEFDLKPLMCEEFYNDLVAGLADEPYKTLIAGGSYTYDGRNYEFRGLGDVLAYFTYARYFLNSPAVSTSHGVVVKSNPSSTPVPLEDRRVVYAKKREEAGLMWADVVKFIERTRNEDAAKFENWECGGCGSSKPSRMKTRVIQ